MTTHEYAAIMYAEGLKDGRNHWPSRHEDVPEYATGYAVGEAAPADTKLRDDRTRHQDDCDGGC